MRVVLLQVPDPVDDTELIANATAHMVGQEQLKVRLAMLGRQMHAKQERLTALQKHLDDNGVKAQYMAQLSMLQSEKKALEKERSSLQQVGKGGSCQGLSSTGA
jgi:hypothetical protein